MIVQQDSLEWLKKQEADSIDHIITDPPYLIDFMGKEWDNEKNVAGSVEYWKEALRVCKAGSYALVFGHSRTHHRVMVAMEDAGWEIRDCLMWIYGSGFPKSQNIGKILDKREGKERKVIGSRLADNIVGNGWGANNPNHSEEKRTTYNYTTGDSEWEGWGSALKPAYEPIIMARKPFKGSLVENVKNNKLGGLNVSTCKVGTEGRFPANIILDEEAGKLLDEQAPSTGNAYKATRKKKTTGGSGNSWTNGGKEEGEDNGIYDGLGGASRFFYCPKVSAKERNFGCEELEDKKFVLNESIKDQSRLEGGVEKDLGWNRQKIRKNHHPTLKPIELMKWLVNLVSIEGQTILDPFMGSGSTGVAVELLGRNFIGVEMDADYCDIAERRITAWKEKQNATE